MSIAPRLFEYNGSVERMPASRRESYLAEQLERLVSSAYRNAPAMRARFDKANLDPTRIHGIADLSSLPVLKKDELVELQRADPPFGGFLGVPLNCLNRIFQSPGPIYDPQRRRQGALAVVLGELFGEGDIVINTWSYHLVPAGISMDEGLQSLGVTVIPTGTGNTEAQVQIIRDLGVTGYCGSTGFLMNIIRKAEELGYDFRKDFKLKKAAAGGEMGGGPMRKIFSEDYGIETRDGYGTADVGPVAHECREQNGMHVLGDVIVEIVDPSTGEQLGSHEVGEVVVTTLDEVYPLIRFGTGDLSSYTEEPCPCGRTTYRLPKILGRVGDAVRVRGMFVHPKQTSETLARFPEVAAYQLVVRRPEHRDEMTLLVELADEAADRDKLRQSLEESVRAACKVRPDRVEFLAKGSIQQEHKVIVDDRVY